MLFKGDQPVAKPSTIYGYLIFGLSFMVIFLPFHMGVLISFESLDNFFFFFDESYNLQKFLLHTIRRSLSNWYDDTNT
jgi:hypothetical protein